MKIAICDDNKEYIEIIENYINKYKTVETQCYVYQDGQDLIDFYKNENCCERYDAVFLDMEMQPIDGIQTANVIRDCDEHVVIIFVTSHTKYMLESFKCLPFRYIVKPIKDEDFREAFFGMCKKVLRERKTFSFFENKNQIRLYCDDIIYFESRNHCVHIYTREKSYICNNSLNNIFDKLNRDMFCRIHKSFIVNLHYIRRINATEVELYHIEDTIPISRSCKKETLEKYTKFIETEMNV